MMYDDGDDEDCDGWWWLIDYDDGADDGDSDC